MGVSWYVAVVSHCISQMTNDVEHLFYMIIRHLCNICDMSIQILCLIKKIRLIIFLVSNYKSSFCILYTKFLIGSMYCRYFLFTFGFLPSLLIWRAEILISVEFNWSGSPFMVHAFCVLCWETFIYPEVFSHMFSSRSFILLDFMFRPTIHFELFFVHFFPNGYPSFQHH